MPSEEDYRREIERLQARLERAEQALQAVGAGAWSVPEAQALAPRQSDPPLDVPPSAGDLPYRVLAEQMHEGALTLSAEGAVGYCNGSFMAMAGRGRADILGQPLERLVAPADVMAVRRLIKEARSAEASAEVRLATGDGAWLPVCLAVAPLHDGLAGGLSVVVTDLTERRHNGAAAGGSGRLAASILDHATEALLVCDLQRRITHANHAAHQLCGVSLVGQPIAVAVGRRLSWPSSESDGRAPIDQAIDDALAGRTVGTREAKLVQPSGVLRELLFGAAPILDACQQVLGCVIRLTDVTEQRQGEERLRQLAAELSHRVKNTIAVIQTIADQTLARTRSMHAFARAFQGRLRALASGHRLLLESHWRSASLRALVDHSLRAAAPAVADHAEIAGPPIDLPPRTAVALGMALHELATNAARHGALSVTAGRVEITWWFDEPARGRRLHLRWVERGGPDVQPPEQTGFGTELIRRTVEYDLDGDVDLAFRADGLCCEIVFRLEEESVAPAFGTEWPRPVPPAPPGDGGVRLKVVETSGP